MSSQPPKQPLDEASLEAVTGGGSIVSPINAGIGTSPVMDLEAALQAVQAQRAGLLEGALADQIAEVQARNAAVADLNGVLDAANSLSAMLQSNSTNAADPKLREALGALLEAVDGLDVEKGFDAILQDGKITKDEMTQFTNSVKSAIDGLHNSQEMDMLRQQSLTNKRNEAFDIMTDFIKKMQDSRSSIVGNMR